MISTFLLSDVNTVVPLEATYPQGVRQSTTQSIVNVLRTIFLPQGYPDSVSDDYLAYQIWDTAQVTLVKKKQ